MRPLILLTLLVGCGEMDVSDLGENAKPSMAQRCNAVAHEGLGGLYDEATYQRCLHGVAAPDDGGARD